MDYDRSDGELHERLVELARERGVVQGRKMRVDTTVVETNVHYPTDTNRASVLASGTFSSPMRVNARYTRFARTSRSSVS